MNNLKRHCQTSVMVFAVALLNVGLITPRVQAQANFYAGKTVTLDLEIPFDATAYRKALAAQRDGGAPGGSGAPSASAKARDSRPGVPRPAPSAKH